ncbi:MAG TPA: hypothetical protein VF009_07060 [Solirubrobacterales bacterium]
MARAWTVEDGGIWEDRALAAESKLQEAIQQLEKEAGTEPDWKLGDWLAGRRYGLNRAAQILRDKGTGMEDLSDRSEAENKSPITAHNEKGAELIDGPGKEMLGRS